MTGSLERWCLIYAAHTGLPVPAEGYSARIHERLLRWPIWGRLAARAAAWLLVQWAAPMSDREREAFLNRLQTTRWLPVRALFMTVKAATLPCCYRHATN